VKKHHFVLAITAITLLASCTSEPRSPTEISLPVTPSPIPPTSTQPEISPTIETAERTVLTFDQLTNGYDPGSPVEEGAFAMPENAKSADHIFEGRLELIGEDKIGDFVVHRGNSDLEPEVPHLPEFDFEFVQSGDYFIPVQRGLIITDHPYWNYIIEPGRVWNEDGDGAYSRVSFPFALVWKGSNAIFNGVMSFLFKDADASSVWYQTTQETTASLSADLWGQLDAAYHPEQVNNAAEVRTEFAEEQANRFPSKPIEQLAEDYSQVDITQFGRGISKNHLTYFGFVFNGVNYVSSCPTRYGEYAYCEYMRAPSYSTAKSTFPSLALMRLAQKYDPQAAELLIKDYVPEYINSPGDWSNVTIDHTLDMATGNFRSAGYMEDEDNFNTDPFWNEEYYAEMDRGRFQLAARRRTGYSMGLPHLRHLYRHQGFTQLPAIHNKFGCGYLQLPGR
jgi:hypothetical protein